GGASRIEDMADYALANMPPRCALLGHSMGGRVALEIYRKAPRRVQRLALACTGIHPVQPGEEDGRHRLRDLGRTDGIGALVDSWLPPMIATAGRTDTDLIDVLRSMCVDAGLSTYENQIAALLNRPSVAGLLPSIACPAFVIAGSEDEWAPVCQHKTIAAAIPGAKLRIIEGAGHMAPAEMPDAFNAIIREWLKAPSAS
ncbi:MAG: alpha/beta fold hydrolase, partial [Sphingobium sp.]